MSRSPGNQGNDPARKDRSLETQKDESKSELRFILRLFSGAILGHSAVRAIKSMEEAR